MNTKHVCRVLAAAGAFAGSAASVSGQANGPRVWQAPAPPAIEIEWSPIEVESAPRVTVPGAASDGLAQQAAPAGTGKLLAAGLGGWAGSWLVGSLAGTGLGAWNPLDSDDVDDGFWVPGMVIGLESAQAVGIPWSVHAANGGRGKLGLSMLASAALGLVGTAILWTGNQDTLTDSGWPVLLSVPVAQIGTSILIERATSR